MDGPGGHRGGSTISAGHAAVAVSVAAMLLAGPRVLSQEEFAGLGVAWTITTVFGFGLAMPLEQVWTRRRTERSSRRRAVARLVVATAVVLAVVVVWARSSAAIDDLGGFALSVSLGLLGWVGVVAVRYRLAAAQALDRYAQVLFVESALRLLLVLVALVLVDGRWFIAASVGGPLVGSAVVGARLLRHVGPLEEAPAVRREVGLVVMAALGYQICLNSGPLLLSTTAAVPPSAIAAFVMANSYLRVPTVLAAGFATQALAQASAARPHAAGRSVARTVRQPLSAAGWIATVSTALLLAVAEPVLPALLGARADIEPVVLVALAVSTIVSVVAAVLTAGLVGHARPQVPATAWSVGAVALVPLLATVSSLGWHAAAGLVSGPLVALLVLTWGAGRAGRTPEAVRP